MPKMGVREPAEKEKRAFPAGFQERFRAPADLRTLCAKGWEV